jgi:2'-5' RNA ligase
MEESLQCKGVIMRAFIAIELPATVQEILYRTCLELGERIASRTAVRWVKPENIHLTLRFLGDIQPDQISQIGRAIDQQVVHLPVFDLELDELGSFPNPRNPRIIWVGIGGDTRILNQLHASIEQELVRFGWEPEGRRFHPHLTVGRVKDRRVVTEANLPYKRKVNSLSFPVKAVSLIESVLKPEGASYTKRYSCPLEAVL